MLKQPIDKIEFQPYGYFYDMVQSYTIALTGLLFYHPKMEAPVNSFVEVQGDNRCVGILSKELGDISISVLEKAAQIKRGDITLSVVINNLTCMLLNTAGEAVKPLLVKNNPSHEFLRHLRNAGSHGGKWTFMGSEPVREAKWRGREIKAELNGKLIWDLNLAEGDIFLLLSEIEADLLAPTRLSV